MLIKLQNANGLVDGWLQNANGWFVMDKPNFKYVLCFMHLNMPMDL